MVGRSTTLAVIADCSGSRSVRVSASTDTVASVISLHCRHAHITDTHGIRLPLVTIFIGRG